jgi:hypothetical protein
MNEVQEIRGEGVRCDSKLLDGKMCIREKEMTKYQRGKPRWNVENLYAVQQKAENFVEDNFLGIGCEIWGK